MKLSSLSEHHRRKSAVWKQLIFTSEWGRLFGKVNGEFSSSDIVYRGLVSRKNKMNVVLLFRPFFILSASWCEWWSHSDSWHFSAFFVRWFIRLHRRHCRLSVPILFSPHVVSHVSETSTSRNTAVHWNAYRFWAASFLLFIIFFSFFLSSVKRQLCIHIFVSLGQLNQERDVLHTGLANIWT